MNHSSFRLLAWLALCGSATFAADSPLDKRSPLSGAAPRVTVTLIADHEAVTPGQRLTLALRFKVEEGWHIYWRNPGASGLPPTVKWKLPPGFEVGTLQFAAPRRYPTDVGDSLILEGEPTLLAALTVPDDAVAGTEVEIAGEAHWLVCKESCVRERQGISLRLPVQAKDAPPKPANETAFRLARRRMPIPAAEARYFTLQAVANVDRIRPRDAARIALVLDLKKGHHIQSNKPLSKDFVPTDVFPDDVPGLTVGEPQFPPDHRRHVPELGEVAEYTGRVTIVIPITANPDLRGPDVRISGVLTSQACDETTGQCFLAEHVEWSVTLPVGPPNASVQTINADIFGNAANSGAGDRQTSEIVAPVGGFTVDRPLRVQREETSRPVWLWLLLAAGAGALLNITPCVLPVISIKVLSLVQQAQESPGKVFRLGLAFSAGMILVMNGLAVLATGANLVWGQHFQSVGFVVGMTAIIFAFGLSLFGVFTLGVPRTLEEMAGRQSREGYLGSVAKGAMATALGTPCLGPGLGSVLTWVVAQPPAVIFLVFNAIGVGMAAPYIVLTANPQWLRFVPRPGPWLETFKHVMGFLLMATVVYLVGIIEGQGRGTVPTIAFLTGVGVACWLWGRYNTPDRTAAGRVAVGLAALAVLIFAGWLAFARLGTVPPTTRPAAAGADAGRLPWQPFSLDRLEKLTAEGKTVMVDVTAEWCLNCKYNLSFVFHTKEVTSKVRELGVVPLLADWTGPNEEIDRFMESLAPGASIPLLAIFPAGRPTEPAVLLGILTKDQVLTKLAQAGPSR